MTFARRLLLVLSLSLVPEAARAAGVPPDEEAREAARQQAPQVNPLHVLPPPPETGIRTQDQARLRLQDICVYQAAAGTGAEGSTGPRCACYAQRIARTLQPDEIASLGATDEVPPTARERAVAIWQACAGSR